MYLVEPLQRLLWTSTSYVEPSSWVWSQLPQQTPLEMVDLGMKPFLDFRTQKHCPQMLWHFLGLKIEKAKLQRQPLSLGQLLDLKNQHLQPWKHQVFQKGFESGTLKLTSRFTSTWCEKWWSWTPDILFKPPRNDWHHGDFTKTILIKLTISHWLFMKFHRKWGKKPKADLDSSTRIQPTFCSTSCLRIDFFKRKETREMIPPLKWSQKKKRNEKNKQQMISQLPRWDGTPTECHPQESKHPWRWWSSTCTTAKPQLRKVGLQGIPQIYLRVSLCGCTIQCFNVYIHIYIYLYTYIYICTYWWCIPPKKMTAQLLCVGLLWMFETKLPFRSSSVYL